MNAPFLETKSATLAARLVRAVSVIAATAGVGSLSASYVPYDLVFQLLFGVPAGEAANPQGAVSLAAHFPAIVMRLRVLGLILLGTGVAFWLSRRFLSGGLQRYVFPFPSWALSVARSTWRGALKEPATSIAVLAMLFAGAAVRLHFIHDPVSFDEADTLLSYASRPLPVALSWYPMPNNHLLHTFFLHFSQKVFGVEPWAIRIPALLAGVLLIPLAYCFGRVLIDVRTGLVLAALVTTSAPLIRYSVDARGYTLQCALFLLLLLVSNRILAMREAPAWLLWSVLVALGFYTIPTTLYAFASVVCWMAIALAAGPLQVCTQECRVCTQKRRYSLIQLVTAAGIALAFTGVLYLPVLVVSGLDPLIGNPYVAPKTLDFVLSGLLPHLEATARYFLNDQWPVASVLLVIGLIPGLWRLREERSPFLWYPPIAVGVFLLIVLLQRNLPFTRVWTFFLPVLLLLSATGLLRLIGLAVPARWRISRVLSVFLVLVALIGGSWSVLHGDSVRRRSVVPGLIAFASWWKAHSTPKDFVLAKLPTTAPLRYYARRAGLSLRNTPAPCDGMSSVLIPDGAKRPGANEIRRVLTVVALSSQTVSSVRSIACLPGDGAGSKLVLETSDLRIYESFEEVLP